MLRKNKQITIFMLALMLFSYFVAPLVTSAAVKYYGKVLASDGLTVRQGPGTKYNKIGEVAFNTQVELVSGSPVSTSGCSMGWYQINYNSSKEAYVCGTYLSITSQGNTSNTPEDDYERQLQNLGFPSTYWSYLSELHKKHPNWTFEPIKTNIYWSTAVAKQSVVGVSLIQTKYDGWKSTASGSYDPSTKKFIVLEGSNWYAASSGVVAYYMDPRNFLDEKHVFMFEKLNYDASYQNANAVKSVFNGGNMSNYADSFVSAGATYNINPIYLASRVRQEVGASIGVSKATTGEQFTYDGKTYSGLYNVYNIGATTGRNAVLRGLVYANGGSNGSATSHNRPWKSIEASISGGAQMIASSYISKGQYTTYLQRFNVDPNSKYTALTHGYMTNIQAVYSESLSTYNSYANMNLLNNSFKFAIPIYNNMPTNTELPSTKLDESTLPKDDTANNNNNNNNNNGNNNNNNTVTIDPNKLINTVGLKTDGSTITGIYEGMEVDLLTASLRNNGGDVSTSAHGYLATGDKLNINNKSYTVILYGDLNADAKIGLADLVQLKKYILGYNNLNSDKLKAADVNKDGKVTLTDLVLMKKKILKISEINQ